MRYLFLSFFIVVYSVELYGQAVNETIQGNVSFISSQNVYVKFKSTEGISAGDTLYISSNGTQVAVLKVNNLSSSSCICVGISSFKVSIGDQIKTGKKSIALKPVAKVIENVEKKTTVEKDSSGLAKKSAIQDGLKQKIRGSLSAYSYSDFSNTSANNSSQLRYTFSIDARNIANSKFSFENYMSFRHKLGDWSAVKSNIFNALKIYSLNVRYDLNKTTQISLGRKINQKISSIGAMDGLQVEKSFNKFGLGALVGSRPDFADYGFDSKLLQYGAYLALNLKKAESSVAFMQQMNNGKTDRRFLYFQHSNSLIKNIYIFSTFEIDLYKQKSDTLNNVISQNSFNLTGLYLSLRYRMTKNLSVTGSYDARRNVMYYETYKSFIDRIIESEMRQSFRISVNYRITRDLMFGLQPGYRFLKTDPHPSKNVYTYLTYSQIPGLNMSFTISGTYLESNYLKGKILGVNTSKDFFNGKLYTELGYNYIDYRYTENLQNTIQSIGDLNLSWQLSKKMSFSFNYEGTFEKQVRYDRLYLQIRIRF